MSQSVGESEAARRSISPASLKRKRTSPSYPPSNSSPREISKSTKLTNGATSLTGSHLQHSSTYHPSAKQYPSPDSDELQQSESGDLLQGVGSASSLTSTASSVFSANNTAFTHNRKASLANGLTPLTNHTESSPRRTSPKHHAEMASINGALLTTSSHVPASDITPEPTHASQERRQMLPPPGRAKGYRVVWDPELDNKLSKEERKRAIPRKKEFGAEVRYTTFHNDSLSLYNVIKVT